jgi:Protein of unknown function (DUF2806)
MMRDIHEPAGDKKREIEDDWLFKFARYAQDVSDREMQELWGSAWPRRLRPLSHVLELAREQ